MKKAEEISAPLERKRPSGVPAQLASGAVQAAPLLAGAATPFVKGAGLLSKVPVVGKTLQSAAGFGAFETAKAGVTGQISTPAYVTIGEEAFGVTNYPDLYGLPNGRDSVYRVGIGIARTEQQGSHVTIGYVSAYKKITTDWPVVIIKL